MTERKKPAKADVGSAIMMAADALEKAAEAREERDEAVREALVAEVVAAVESRAAAQARQERDEAVQEVHDVGESREREEIRDQERGAQPGDVAEQGTPRQSKSGAPRSSSRRSAVPKPPNPKPARRSVKR